MEKAKNIFYNGHYAIVSNMYETDSKNLPPIEILPALNETHEKVMEMDESVVPDLLHWIDKYPDLPQFANNLGFLYSLKGDLKEAHHINRQLVERFPDYLYGKLNLAQEYIEEERMDKVPELLGPSLEL